MRSIANLNSALQEGLAAAQRIFTMLDTEPVIQDAPDAKPLEITGGAVSFEGVTHAYSDGAPALRDISFDVPAGKTVALVGPSGAGKSTALNLIPRFYDTEQGRVTIDGQDVKTVTQTSLRAAIGLVSQESTLFNDTIRANIAYGRPGASDDEIESAAKAAAAHDFITDLADGYHSMVGESGLSSRAGSASASPSRARSSRTPPSCYWTKQHRRWMQAPNGWCKTPSSGSAPGVPLWWWRTGSPR